MKLALTLVLNLGAPGGHAVIGRHDVPAEAYEALGADPRFANVGQVVIAEPASADRSRWKITLGASGVWIAPGWVLVSAHQASSWVSSTEPLFPVPSQVPDRWQILGFKIPEVDPDSFWFVNERIVAPRYRPPVGNGYDIALFRIAPRAYNAYSPLRLSEANPVGREITFAGFGWSGNGIVGEVVDPAASGVRRAGQNLVDGFGSDFPLMSPEELLAKPWTIDSALNRYFYDGEGLFIHEQYRALRPSEREIVFRFDPPEEGRVSLAMEANVAHGDSGGGVFMNADESSVELVGIVSSLTTFPKTGVYNGHSRATWIAPYIPWIRDHIRYASYQLDSVPSGQFSAPVWAGTHAATNSYEWTSAPGPGDVAVFNLPAVGDGFVRKQLDFNTLEWRWMVPRRAHRVDFESDVVVSRLRVRRASDLDFWLNGHELALTSTSAYTAALTVAEGYGDLPRLGIQGGRVRAHDCEIAGDAGGGSVNFSTWGILDVSGPTTELEIERDIFIGCTKTTPLAQPDQDHPWPVVGANTGRAELLVRDGARVVVGGLMKLGRRWTAGQVDSSRENGGYLKVLGGSAEIGVLAIDGGSVSHELGRLSFQHLVMIGGVFTGSSLTVGRSCFVSGLGALNTGLNNLGTVQPGLHPFDTQAVAAELPLEDVLGELRIGGPYSQDADGELRVRIRRDASGWDADALSVDGEATVGGTLTVDLLSVANVEVGNRVQVVRARNLSGRFDSVVLNGPVERRRFLPEYSGDAVSLVYGSTDSDDDGLADWWELRYFGTIVDVEGSGDPDGDEITNFLEQEYGTDPTESAPILRIERVQLTPSGDIEISWRAREGLDYRVWAATEVGGAESVLVDRVAAVLPRTSVVVRAPGRQEPSLFLRVQEIVSQ